MPSHPAQNVSADAARLATHLPYTPSDMQLLLDAHNGDPHRALMAARFGSQLNWPVGHVIRMQSLMAQRLRMS